MTSKSKVLGTFLNHGRSHLTAALIEAERLIPVGTMVYFKWHGKQKELSTGAVMRYIISDLSAHHGGSAINAFGCQLRVQIDHAQAALGSRYPTRTIVASEEFFALNGVKVSL